MSLSATKLHIEHIETEATTQYWHMQDLWVSELDGTVVRGLTHSLAAQLTLPVRSVRDRIRFEDIARRAYFPPVPDTHHRNETLTYAADVRLGLQWARIAPPWTLTASGGVSLPTGRTESNPFALGRLGLPHQHIQFGTGTVDPYGVVIASRRVGVWSVSGSTSARVTLTKNAHGYRAGNRYAGALSAARPVVRAWSVRVGCELAREASETWDRRVEEEGNLGRTDLFASLGGSRAFAFATLGATVRVPVYSHVTGAQADLPLVAQITLSR